jgi:signal transduction histidine kinase
MSGMAEAEHSASKDDASLVRQALAELLHDGPLQELVALQLKAANLARLGQLGHVDRAARVLELSDLAQAAIEHLKQIIRDLAVPAPPPLEPLYRRFVTLCEDFRLSSGIKCELAVEPAHLKFRSHLGEVMHRTLRELLANVRKHARANIVTISSEHRPDGSVAISVEDDGIGLPALSRDATPFAGGFGLRSIEQGLAAFDAFLELDGETGLCATVVVPARWLAGHR